MSIAHEYIIKSAVLLIHPALVSLIQLVFGAGRITIWIVLEILRKHTFLRKRTSHREGVSHDRPLRLTKEIKHFPNIMQKSNQMELVVLLVRPCLSNTLSSLEVMVGVRLIAIRVRIVDKFIKQFHCFFYRHLHAFTFVVF